MRSPKRTGARKEGPITIGMDLGDKTSRYCVLGENGERLAEGSVATTRKAMTQKFAGMRLCRVSMEVASGPLMEAATVTERLSRFFQIF